MAIGLIRFQSIESRRILSHLDLKRILCFNNNVNIHILDEARTIFRREISFSTKSIFPNISNPRWPETEEEAVF